MMEALVARANRIARAAQIRRLEQIVGSLRDRGVVVETGADAVAIRGRRLTQRWLSDPLVRFAGRYAQ
jgi:hypothetical protein